jgi:subtilisin
MTAFDENLWRSVTIDSLRERTGRGVHLAIVDSGVDAEHPDLRGKIVESVEAHRTGGRIKFRPARMGDEAGHGTACAGIIARFAPDAAIHSIKVLGASASGSSAVGSGDAFLAGLHYAIEQRIRIINLSLGTTRQELCAPLHELLDRAYQANCVVVAAANNLPQPSFPSVFSSSLVSVSKKMATNEDDPFDFTFHYGETIELAANGVGVRTTWLGGGYRNLTGNSFAAPHIAAVIALILEAQPNLTPFQIKTLLYTLARR